MKDLEHDLKWKFEAEMRALEDEHRVTMRQRREYGLSEISFNEYLQAALVSERRYARHQAAQRKLEMQSPAVTPARQAQITITLVEQVLAKLPDFSADWDRDFQEQWWDVIQTLLDLIHPLSMTEVTLAPLPMGQSITDSLLDLMRGHARAQTEADQEVTGDGGA